jgi:short-subunit dehydrogenase
MRRTDRVVVIIGGSRGIGRAAAASFARRGGRLVLVARDEGALEEAAAECRALGAEVLVVAGDITEPAVLAGVVSAALDRFGRIDVWVGAAGVFVYGLVEQTPTDVFRRVLDINLVAHVEGVRQVLPVFRAQGSGRIVLVGSLFSEVTAPYVSAYVASKFALRGFARTLRQELRNTPGIDVRIVFPASIDTPIYQRSANFTGRVPHPLPPVTSPYRVARVIERASRGAGPHSVHVGRLQSSMVLLSTVLPRVYDRVISGLVETLGLRRRPAPITLGALDAPQAGPSQITGDWRSPALRVAVAVTTAAGAASLLGRRRRR